MAMAEGSPAVAMRVLAQLPSWMDCSEPEVLCRLLCTSRSLHDQLQQPGSCKQLMTSVHSIEHAAALASWLGTYGVILQDLTIFNCATTAQASPSSATTINHCIASGMCAIPGNHLCCLRLQSFELPASLVKAQALRDLQEVQVEQPGCRSLMHLSALTSVTHLRLDFQNDYTWPEPDDLLVSWPTGLRRLEINCDPPVQLSFVISGLTSLTSLCYSGPRDSFPCPALPAAPAMRALKLEFCDVDDVLETISLHMKGLQTLIIPADARTDQRLRQLFVELRGLKALSVRDIKTAAGVSAVACATGVESLWLDVPKVAPAELKHLSLLTGLTSLSLCGWRSVAARPGGKTSKNVMYAAGLSVLSASLPHLVRLAVYSNLDESGYNSSTGLQVIGMLFDPAFFPRLRVWIVPQEWVADCDRYSAEGRLIGAEADLLPGSRQLLADLRQVRPGLVINWWLVMCDCYGKLDGLFKL